MPTVVKAVVTQAFTNGEHQGLGPLLTTVGGRAP